MQSHCPIEQGSNSCQRGLGNTQAASWNQHSATTSEYIHYCQCKNNLHCIFLQAVAAEAGGVANQPTEQAGMSPEVIQKLQDKAAVLTQERKKRGRTVPEELTTHEQLRNFKTLASLIVRNVFYLKVHDCIVEYF